VSRRLRDEARRDFLWRTLCVRDVLTDAPPPLPHDPRMAYAFLARWPRPGDLIEADIGGWTVLRVVLRLDARRVLALPTRQPTRAGVLLFVWLDTEEDTSRVRAAEGANGGSSSTVASFLATRSEQRRMLQVARTLAGAKIAASSDDPAEAAAAGAPVWPLWHPSMASLAMYRKVHGAQVWDGAGSGAAGTWLLWCSCPVATPRDPAFWKAVHDGKLGAEDDPKPAVLQMAGSVLVDARPGMLLEALDTVNLWYCAQITAVRRDNGALLVTVSFDGWGPAWDEEIDAVRQAHRLRPLGDNAAKGPAEGFDRLSMPPARFVGWSEFVKSPAFSRATWAMPDVYRILARGANAKKPLVGSLIEVLDMRNVSYVGEIIAIHCPAESASLLPTSVEVRYIGAERTETLHIITDRHRMRPLSRRPPSSPEIAPRIERPEKPLADFVCIPFSEIVFDSPPWEDPL
jgi:hypothetical protein